MAVAVSEASIPDDPAEIERQQIEEILQEQREAEGEYDEPILMNMFIMTFGDQYRHEQHARFWRAHPDGYVSIIAEDETQAKSIAFGLFGRQWSMLYTADEFFNHETLSLYTRGELLHIAVTLPSMKDHLLANYPDNYHPKTLLGKLAERQGSERGERNPDSADSGVVRVHKHCMDEAISKANFWDMLKEIVDEFGHEPPEDPEMRARYYSLITFVREGPAV